MLGVGVLSGMVLNLINVRDEAGRLPWNDPVVLSTWLMFFWLLAAVVLGALYRPARQGRKVAYLTLASFVFLAIMLAAGLLMHSRHWGRGEGEGGRGKDEWMSTASSRPRCMNRPFIHSSFSTPFPLPPSPFPSAGGRPC